MKQTNFVLLSALLLLALLSTTTFAYSCSYTGGGSTYNFKGFPVINGQSDVSQSMTLSLCEPLTACDSTKHSVICQPSMPSGVDYGNLKETPKPHAVKVTGGVALAFNNGSEACYDSNLMQKYRTRVIITCSEVQSNTFTMVRGSGCERIINIESPFGCGSGGDDGLSGGAIFLIIIFSLWAAYFVLGFLVCKFYFKKATITESIPHFAFWVSLPGWYIAGIKVAIAFVQSKLGKKSSAGEFESSDTYGATDEAV